MCLHCGLVEQKWNKWKEWGTDMKRSPNIFISKKKKEYIWQAAIKEKTDISFCV